MVFVSGSSSQNFSLLQEFYQTTLKALEEAQNEVGLLTRILCIERFVTLELISSEELYQTIISSSMTS